MTRGSTAAFVSETCCNCGVEFGVTKGLYDLCRADSKRSFYCPNGHGQHYATSEADELRRERDRLKQNAAYLEDRAKRLREERDAAVRQASAARGQVTRLKNRAAAGLCPCCNRSFQNLQRHMQSKHAGFTAEEVSPEGAALQ